MQENRENKQNILTDLVYLVLSYIILFLQMVFFGGLKTNSTDKQPSLSHFTLNQKNVEVGVGKETATKYPTYLQKNFKYRRKLILDIQLQNTKSE